MGYFIQPFIKEKTNPPLRRITLEIGFLYPAIVKELGQKHFIPQSSRHPNVQ